MVMAIAMAGVTLGCFGCFLPRKTGGQPQWWLSGDWRGAGDHGRNWLKPCPFPLHTTTYYYFPDFGCKWTLCDIVHIGTHPQHTKYSNCWRSPCPASIGFRFECCVCVIWCPLLPFCLHAPATRRRGWSAFLQMTDLAAVSAHPLGAPGLHHVSNSAVIHSPHSVLTALEFYLFSAISTLSFPPVSANVGVVQHPNLCS